MEIDLTTFAFNSKVDGTTAGTPSWSTALGQNASHKINDGWEDILKGLVYKSISVRNVRLPLGKGGRVVSGGDDSEEAQRIVHAAKFTQLKIRYVENGRADEKAIHDAAFVLCIIRDMIGVHTGRLGLKYSNKIEISENGTWKNINELCIEKIKQALSLNDDACWFVYGIDIENQDELVFDIGIVSRTEKQTYSSAQERKNEWKRIISNKTINDGNAYGWSAPRMMDESETKKFNSILYGPPGTGKSRSLKDGIGAHLHIRTTFHPDSDYATFVGAYKPTQDASGEKIVYRFVPQAFLKAYIDAWMNPDQTQYLIIEEINRGNCAQIFGDLFQLLDRNSQGYSEYPIDADEDLGRFLKGEFKDAAIADGDIRSGQKLCLPPNLLIRATMNTSDQSLFPIDSAFKRRWDWEYVPIRDADKGWKIAVDGQTYDWWRFLEAINGKIAAICDSEDKQMGYFFVKPDEKSSGAVENDVISSDVLVNKVFFYLWNDVFRNYGFDDGIFSYPDGKAGGSGGSKIGFRDFFDGNGKVKPEVVRTFLDNLKVAPESTESTDSAAAQAGANGDSAGGSGNAEVKAGGDASDTPSEGRQPAS